MTSGKFNVTNANANFNNDARITITNGTNGIIRVGLRCANGAILTILTAIHRRPPSISRDPRELGTPDTQEPHIESGEKRRREKN